MPTGMQKKGQRGKNLNGNGSFEEDTHLVDLIQLFMDIKFQR